MDEALIFYMVGLSAVVFVCLRIASKKQVAPQTSVSEEKVRQMVIEELKNTLEEMRKPKSLIEVPK